MKRYLPFLIILLIVLTLTGCEYGGVDIYTIAFETDGGSAVRTQTVKSGQTAIEPKDPVKSGSVFREWMLDGEKFDFSTQVTRNITLKAVYDCLYTVTYDTDGGTEVAPVTVKEGTALTEPATPVKKGTNGFAKWVRTDDGSNAYYDFSKNSPVTSDMTLKAVYHDDTSCTVTFDSDGGTGVRSQTLKSGETLVAPRDPERSSSFFRGWFRVNEDGTTENNEYNFSEPVTENFTLKALYYRTFTVTFDSEGESSVVDVKEGDTVTEPRSPEKDDAVFKEWTLDGKKYDFSTPVTKNITLKAQYYSLYTVTFDTDGGSKVASVTVREGLPLTEPATPVKEGTNGFAKWVRTDDGSNEYYDFSHKSAVTSDMTLKAVYLADTSCTVTFDSDGGSEVSPQTLKSGETLVTPRDPEKKDFYFKEWVRVNADGTTETDAYNFTEPVTEGFTLKAVYYRTFTVTFDTNGGDALSTTIIHVREGESVTEPRGPEKKNAIFREWTIDGRKYDFSTPVKKNITLLASYTNIYTVSFDTDGAETEDIQSQSVVSGSSAVEPRDPEKDGAVFREWTLNGSSYDFSLPVTANITLKAAYDTVFTITFDTSGGSEIAPMEVEAGNTPVKPSDPVKTGTKGFLKWIRVDDGSYEAYDFTLPVTSDIVLRAVYTDDTSYTVTFDSDGGTYVSSQSLKSGDKVVTPRDPEKNGTYFKEWVKVSEEGKAETSAYDFNSTVDESFTLKAVYYTTYTVTFDSNGGSAVTNRVQFVKAGECAVEPKNPEKDNAVFYTWTVDAKNYDFSTPVTGDIILKAEYREVYTVSFDTDGASGEIEDQKVESLSCAIEPKDPVKTKSVFKSWTLDEESYDFSTPVTSDITLKATYTDIYTVTFDTDGAIFDIESEEVVSGSCVTEPKNPLKESAEFKAWTLDGETYDFSSPVTSDITLKAQYYTIYAVTFETNGGSYIPPQEVIGGSTLIEPDSPVKSGTTGFAKWIRTDDGSNEAYDFSLPVTSDMTLSAVYTEDASYIVTFNCDGGTKIASQSLKSGEKVIEPKNPEKKNTYFRMWVKVSSDGTVADKAYDFSEAVTESFTLKAVYYTTYTVTFWSMGGSSPVNDVQYVREGGFVTEPARPVNNSKWGFREWVKVNDDGTTESFDFLHTGVYSNLTFRATYWEKYTVLYKDADGNGYAQETIKEGEKASLLEGPKNGSLVFKCWVIEGTDTEFDFSTPVTSNVTLVPVYGYSVTFDSDGGDYTPSVQYVEDGGTALEPRTPDKAGTRGFMWWVTEDGYCYDFSSPVKENIVLKAVYWPATLSVEDYTTYDNTMIVLKNEVRAIHLIVRKLVNNESLMKGGTDFSSVFGNTDTTGDHNDADALLLDIFTNALMTPGKVSLDGDTFNTSELDTYRIKTDECAISSNASKFKTTSIDTRRYTIDITGLKIKMNFYKDNDPYEYKEDQTVVISLKGTFLRNSDDRYEMHVQLTVNGEVYPILHATATKSGDNGDDNVLAFSYEGYSGYIPGIKLW